MFSHKKGKRYTNGLSVRDILLFIKIICTFWCLPNKIYTQNFLI